MTPTPTGPRIRIELYGIPRLRAGTGRVEVVAATIGAALSALAGACPPLEGTVLDAVGGLHPAYWLSLNGARFLTAGERDLPLQDGDCLIVLSADAGGQAVRCSAITGGICGSMRRPGMRSVSGWRRASCAGSSGAWA